MRVLLVAHRFPPYSGVGAKRISYWHDYLNKNGVECDVVTATVQASRDPQVYYQRALNLSWCLKWFAFDEGLEWLLPLYQFLRKEAGAYDVILFTGGPFFHFLAAFAIPKPTRVVLDYRDPWSNNPLTSSTRIKKIIKTAVEKLILRRVSGVIATTEYCLDLVPQHSAKVCAIDNGYDERITAVTELSPNDPTAPEIKLIYAGKLNQHRSLTKLIAAIRAMPGKTFALEHVGPKITPLPAQIDTTIACLGERSYRETLSHIASADVGVVLSSGDPMESTTKVFDYIALRKIVLVVEQTPSSRGALRDIACCVPAIFFCENDHDDIVRVLRHIQKNRKWLASELEFLGADQLERFSRSEGAKLLLSFLCEISP